MWLLDAVRRGGEVERGLGGMGLKSARGRRIAKGSSVLSGLASASAASGGGAVEVVLGSKRRRRRKHRIRVVGTEVKGEEVVGGRKEGVGGGGELKVSEMKEGDSPKRQRRRTEDNGVDEARKELTKLSLVTGLGAMGRRALLQRSREGRERREQVVREVKEEVSSREVIEVSSTSSTEDEGVDDGLEVEMEGERDEDVALALALSMSIAESKGGIGVGGLGMEDEEEEEEGVREITGMGRGEAMGGGGEGDAGESDSSSDLEILEEEEAAEVDHIFDKKLGIREEWFDRMMPLFHPTKDSIPRSLEVLEWGGVGKEWWMERVMEVLPEMTRWEAGKKDLIPDHEVKQMWYGDGPDDEVLVHVKKEELKRVDAHFLAPGRWLSDGSINFYTFIMQQENDKFVRSVVAAIRKKWVDEKREEVGGDRVEAATQIINTDPSPRPPTPPSPSLHRSSSPLPAPPPLPHQSHPSLHEVVQGLCGVVCFDSVFVQNLWFAGGMEKAAPKYDFKKARPWSVKHARVDLFAYRRWVIPINVGNNTHWIAMVVDTHERSITVYDSLGKGYGAVAEAVRRFVIDEYEDKRQSRMTEEEKAKWHIVSRPPQPSPRQTNGVDCGAFCCANLAYLADPRRFLRPEHKDRFDWGQANMDQWRVLIVKTILLYKPLA